MKKLLIALILTIVQMLHGSASDYSINGIQVSLECYNQICGKKQEISGSNYSDVSCMRSLFNKLYAFGYDLAFKEVGRIKIQNSRRFHNNGEESRYTQELTESFYQEFRKMIEQNPTFPRGEN